ncbi:hypothetical protein ACOSP7_030513 [Xanthoceras sorbifolium]
MLIFIHVKMTVDVLSIDVCSSAINALVCNCPGPPHQISMPALGFKPTTVIFEDYLRVMESSSPKRPKPSSPHN